MVAKRQDLAGPGIGDYNELEKVLPVGYDSLLTRKETQQAIFAAKNYIEQNLCKELNLMMVTVPLIVDVESGVNDLLDREGSRTPIPFHISNNLSFVIFHLLQHCASRQTEIAQSPSGDK